mgnify:CR=1 FL=1
MLRAFVSVSDGTGLSPGVFSVLLLFSFIEFTGAVCTHCYGSADGCPGIGYENCPWYTTVATNAAAMVSAAAATKGTMGCGVVSMDLFPTYHSHHRFSMLIPHLALSQRAKKNDII